MTARTVLGTAIAVLLLAAGTAVAILAAAGSPRPHPPAVAGHRATARTSAPVPAGPALASPNLASPDLASPDLASSAGRSFPRLVPAAAPAGWPRLTLPGDGAVLSYPPGMRRAAGDRDAVTAARVGPGGVFRLYLNATPRQGGESLGNWAAFRVRLLRSDDASLATLVAAAQRLRFRGGTGSCVIDDYVTRIGAHRYTELACLVRGRTSASVIVAAAPTAQWPRARPVLERAVTAYQVH